MLAHLKMTLYAEFVELHCCFSRHSNASSSTLLHTLHTFAIFAYFALVPSHALGASTSRADTLFFSVLILHQMQPSFSSLHQSKGFHILKMVKVLVSGIFIPLPAKASLSSGGIRKTASIICILIVSIQCTPRNVAVLYVGKSETASGVSFAIPPPFADSLLCICTQN